MPPLNHPSPRLAIQNWLLHSATKPSDRQGSPQGCSRGAKGFKSGGSTRQKATGDDFPGRNRDRSEDVKSRTFSMARQDPSSRRSPWESGLDDESLPQRLGLYAPFRSFGRQSNDMDMDQHSIPASARKRRRNLPSTSSDVEPATFKTHTELETNGCVHRSISSATANIAEMKETVSDSNNSHSGLSTHSRERTEKIYGRKPRRKTREDRYDLKQDKVVEKPRKRKKRHHAREREGEREGKRRKKSGSRMMHDFSAENIVPKRLTLKSASTFGLFNKGRASSPVKRKGLPDLSFSELSFLKSKREKPNDSIKDKIKESRLKKHNDWDADANISRYFVSRKFGDQCKCLSGPKTSKLSERATPESEYPSRGRMGRNVTSSVFVNISEKPCLGSGSSRVDLTSPARNTGRRTNLQSPKPSSTPPASLVSWSVSGVPSHHDSIDRDIENAPGDMPKARTIMKTDHQASVTGYSQQEPNDSVPLRRKGIHSSDTCKVSKFDVQQEGPPGFGNALSKPMMADHARVPEGRANGREKGMFMKELVFSGREDSPNQELQSPCDAAHENCPKSCLSITHSPHGSVRSRATNTMFLPENLDNVHCGNPTLLSQMNHGIQDSITECIYENSEALNNNFLEPRIIPRARLFELRTDQPKEQLELGLIDHALRINQYNNVDAREADRSKGLDRLSTGSSNHEFCTIDASNNHEKPPQRRIQMRNLSNGGFDEHCHCLPGNGCFKHTNRLAGLENLDERLVACNPGNFPNHELGAIDDHRNDSFYGRNDSTEIFEGLSNSYDERKPLSALHEIEELPSQYSTQNETILNADIRNDQPSLQENMDAGYYSVLEDSHEDLLDSESDPAGWHQNNNRKNESLLRDNRCFESFLARHDTWNGAGNIVDTRQRAAMLQLNDELVIPGFWKPQKLY